MFIYQQKKWPNFEYDSSKLINLLALVKKNQGELLGKMSAIGFDLRKEADLEILTADVLKSTEIEGDLLKKDEVRSSLARRLGLEIPGLIDSPRDVDGIVDVSLDATKNADKKLSKTRICSWQSALFPSGRSGLYKITVGKYRDGKNGPMQVVSGVMGRETVHFEAPDAGLIDKEMKVFLNWLNKETKDDLVIKSAIAHLWFVTIHPFEDGNGRIARAISDLFLSRSDESPLRFYSMSSQIMKERKEYYRMLELTQRGELDITLWIEWFLNCLKRAIDNSKIELEKVLVKHKLFTGSTNIDLNERQRDMISRIVEGFEGNITAVKWSKITKCSKDTALRDIKDLIEKGLFIRNDAGGRSTNYQLDDSFLKVFPTP